MIFHSLLALPPRRLQAALTRSRSRAWLPGEVFVPPMLQSTVLGPPWSLIAGTWETEAQRGQTHRLTHTAARHLDPSQNGNGKKEYFQGLPFSGRGLNIMAAAAGSSDRGGQEVRRFERKRVVLFRENLVTSLHKPRFLTSTLLTL